MVPPHLQWRGHGDHHCYKCKASFGSLEAKLVHMRQKQRAGMAGHVHCQICAENFYTQEGMLGHLREVHPKSHELQCPACNAGPFSKLSMLVAHIEKGGCRRMDAELLDQLREKKMEFTKGLKQMTNEPIKHDFSVYLPSHAYTRARNEFDEQQTRRLAGASPPSYDAPSSSNAFNRAWPNVSGAQDDSYSSHSSNWGIPNIMDAEIKHAKTPNMSPDAKSTKHSNEDIPSITDTEVDDLKPAYQHSMPAHLAGQQQLPDPKASPWDQKPTGLQHRSDSPWSQKPAGLQHRPESRCSTLLSGPQQRSNAQTPSGDQNVTWGQKLFPNASPAKRPTEKQLDAAYKPSEKQKHRLMDPDSPEHPNFNPAKYRSPYSGKFVCPKQGCGKCVKSAGGLIAHLNSEAHSDQMYTCPRCLGRYRSLTAFTAHIESESTRCNVRDARDFDALIDQVTSGLVDVAADKNDDGTNKYQVNKTAQNRVKDLGSGDPSCDEKERNKTFRNEGWDDIKPVKIEGW